MIGYILFGLLYVWVGYHSCRVLKIEDEATNKPSDTGAYVVAFICSPLLLPLMVSDFYHTSKSDRTNDQKLSDIRAVIERGKK